MDRHITPIAGGKGEEHDLACVTAGLVQAGKCCVEHDTELLIYTEAKRQFRTMGLAQIAGQDAVDALQDREKFKLNLDGLGTITVGGETLNTSNYRPLSGEERTILAVYPNEKMVENFEASNAPCVVAVPWNDVWTSEWESEFNPREVS